MDKEEAEKIVATKPEFPDPAPEEPDSDSSVEEVNMGIQDQLYGELEHAYHT
jgi:hypothetical protein